MPSFNPRSFTNVDKLRGISGAHLMSFFAKWNAHLAKHGIDLAGVNAEDFPHHKIAKFLVNPDANLPDDLIDALYYVHETANQETMNDLLDRAHQAGIEITSGPTSTPSDVSIQIWLKNPKLLQRQHAETLAFDRTNFTYFAGSRRRGAKPSALRVDDEILSHLQGKLDDWFENKKRGRNSRVFAFPRGAKTWFLVRHGMPLRREGKHLEEGDGGIAVFQPQKHDVLTYDAITDEMGVNATTKGERELYLEAFGSAFFGSCAYFNPSKRYTLEPLRQVGPGLMVTDDIAGLSGVQLTELGRIWHGKQMQSEVRRSDDLFAALGDRWQTVLAGGILTHATFRFQFDDSKRKRSVTIRPANIAKYDRDSDEDMIEAWLRARGFWTEQDEDADFEVLDGA